MLALNPLIHRERAERRTRAGKVGLPPGTLVYTGEKRDRPARITVLTYSFEEFEERQVGGVADALAARTRPGITWINVDGLEDTSLIGELGEAFRIDSLLLEDMVHVGQRPKLEHREDYLFIVVRMFAYIPDEQRVRNEQVSLVLGQDFVLTFQEQEGDVLESVRKRLRDGGRIRGRGPDFLAYAILDAIVDHYFVVLEQLSDRVEAVEQVVIEVVAPEVARAIHRMKRDAVVLRRAVWPLREVVGGLLRDDSVLVREETRPFLRDVYDHAVDALETLETLRDTLSGMLDIHLSTVSNRMNEVMKVLTMIATVFVPLTFVVGIYGMNFENMPELGWRWGYPAILGIMATISFGMLIYFRRKGWL